MTEAPNVPVQPAGVGTPSNVSGQGDTVENGNPQRQEQQAGQGNQYLTAADVQALINDAFERKGQSIADRTTARVQKVLATAQAQGLVLTTQQAQSLLDSADAQAAGQNPPQVQQPGTPAQADPQQNTAQPEQVDPIVAVVNQLYAREQVDIADDDPEHELIDKETEDPVTFLASIKAAIDAKKIRLGKAGSPARMPTLVNSSRPANPVSQTKDPNELWKMATNK